MFENPMLHGAVIFAIAYFVARWWYAKDEEIEDRRREAIKVAGDLKAAHQDWLADFVTDYAVGDYDELGVKIAKLVSMARHDAEMKAFLRKAAIDALTGQLHDPAVRDEVAAKMEAYGDKVGDTPDVAAKPFLDPKVQALVKSLVDARVAAVTAAQAAPVLKTAAELAAMGIASA